MPTSTAWRRPTRTQASNLSGGKVHSESHLDTVDKRHVTVVYDAKDTQKVAGIARSRGVKPSEIYRDALDYYLAAQA